MTKYFVVAICLSASLQADSGPGSSGGGSSSPSTATVRASSERTIPGGSFQLKYFLSQPRPITTGTFGFPANGFFLDGVSASGPATDASGVAQTVNGDVRISIVSPNSTFGTDGYPLLTITMDVPQLPAGTQVTAQLQGFNLTSQGNTLVFSDSKPATITVGGSLSVRGIYPGGGTWPAGTVISIHGAGFQPGTTVNPHLQATPPVYVSPNEMRTTLTHAQTLDGTLFEVSNPDGSQEKFYSYLRGVMTQTPSQPLLQTAEPVFSSTTHAAALVTIPPTLAGQFTAIALQNPNPVPVSVQLSIAATGETASIVLPSQGRMMEDLSVLLGRQLRTGEAVTIQATPTVQMVGIFGDSGAGTVAPFVPAF